MAQLDSIITDWLLLNERPLLADCSLARDAFANVVFFIPAAAIVQATINLHLHPNPR